MKNINDTCKLLLQETLSVRLSGTNRERGEELYHGVNRELIQHYILQNHILIREVRFQNKAYFSIIEK